MRKRWWWVSTSEGRNILSTEIDLESYLFTSSPNWGLEQESTTAVCRASCMIKLQQTKFVHCCLLLLIIALDLQLILAYQSVALPFPFIHRWISLFFASSMHAVFSIQDRVWVLEAPRLVICSMCAVHYSSKYIRPTCLSVLVYCFDTLLHTWWELMPSMLAGALWKHRWLIDFPLTST